ncbi:MAG: hypothetical protein R3D34_15585 [Nitratireductor sp.]
MIWKTAIERAFLPLSAMVLLLLLTIGVAGAQGFQFRDYPADIYYGPSQPPDLNSHPDARTYRTRIREAARAPVNFAGEYVLATWGCGSSCLMGAAVNVRTGEVQFLPGTICCWFEAGDNANPIEFQADSNLLVLTGLLNEQEPLSRYNFVMQNGQFVLLQHEQIGGNQLGGGSQVPVTPPQEPQIKQALVCYYDANGIQRDADSCNIGQDISEQGSTQLGPNCQSGIGAFCDVGAQGQCRNDGGNYSSFQVFDRNSVATCPAQVAQQAGSCEDRCRSSYDQCIAEVARNPNADETFYAGCSEAIDQCQGSCAIARGDCFTYANGGTVCP